MIFFIGEGPSSKNKNPSVPFVGTRSYKRLLEWIWALDIDVTEVVLANLEHIKLYGTGHVAIEQPNMLCDFDFEQDVIIALGSVVGKDLDKLNIPHFKMPHPSFRNRKLNDPEVEVREIEICRDWLKVRRQYAS